MNANLKARVATAGVGIPLLVWLIASAPPWLFTTFFFMLTVGALDEYFAMTLRQAWPQRLAGDGFGVALALAVILSDQSAAIEYFGAALVLVFSASLFFHEKLTGQANLFKSRAGFEPRSRPKGMLAPLWKPHLIVPALRGGVKWNLLLRSLLGALYIGYLIPFVVLLFNRPDGRAWMGWLLFVIMAGDSAAYFIGRRFGKRKLAPSLSPGKTVAGAWGYLLGSLVVGLAGAALILKEVSWLEIMLLSLTLAVLGQLGDLFESWIKRLSAVKDSGNILPGHGGLLDRLDSLVFPAVFTTAYLRMFH